MIKLKIDKTPLGLWFVYESSIYESIWALSRKLFCSSYDIVSFDKKELQERFKSNLV